MVFSILYLLTNFVYAQTCPPTKEIYVKHGNQYIPLPPTGWELNNNWKSTIVAPEKLNFGIAAWGADLHPSKDKDNHVRCYYYSDPLDEKNQVSIQTGAVIDNSQIISHQEWEKSSLYSMCTDYKYHNVKSCPFA